MPELKVEYLPLANLIPYARNARTHSPEQVDQLVASVREFGWTNPVLIDEHSGIIAGHGRVMAAQQMGMDKVPCIRLSHLSETQRRAYVLADNKLALNAGWDEALLEAELEELEDDGFDIRLIGFDELFGDDDKPSEGNQDVKRIQTGPVADRFWISVRGPLAQQAQALQRLLELMGDVGGVEVTLGTVQDA